MVSLSTSGELVNLIITTAVNSFHSERRFSTDLSVAQLKVLLEGLTGASPKSMQLQLFSREGASMGPLISDDASLSSCCLENGMTIQVTDPSVRVGEFEDLSKVKKFELSEEEYAKRAESLRAFKQRNKMGRFEDGKHGEIHDEDTKPELAAKALLDKINVGDRCLVTVLNQPGKRGTVMFKGTTDFKPGDWVGVKYDEPLGKNDGSVEGKRYFECSAKYGVFVRPESVTVGDYPEETLDLDEL